MRFVPMLADDALFFPIAYRTAELECNGTLSKRARDGQVGIGTRNSSDNAENYY